MKTAKRVSALLAAVLLAIGLTGCSKEELREKASDVIIDVAVKMGFISGEQSDGEEEEEEVERKQASAGGEIAFPADFDPTSGRIPATLQNGMLYVGFNGIMYKCTPYFVAADANVTLTAYANHNNPDLPEVEYKIALWQLSDDGNKTSYVPGTTVYFTSVPEGQSCYTYALSGLTPGKRYKLAISSDSYYVSGGVTVTNVSDQDLTTAG